MSENQTTMYFTDAEMTAVLRSWEERFGAVVTSLGSGTVDLVVGAPPSGDRVDQLAAEHLTFTPDQGPIEDLQRLLRSDRPTPDGTYERHWALGWPD